LHNWLRSRDEHVSRQSAVRQRLAKYV